MRNSRLFACSLILALVANQAAAQTETDSGNAPAKTTSVETQVVEVRTLAPDLLVMSAGSVLVVRDKQTSRLETEIRLADGSVLTPGGTVRRPDGSSTMLADNQAISPSGQISTAPAKTVTEISSTSSSTPEQKAP